MEIYGHRGAAGLAPENTMRSFRLAAELGCWGIECDVHAVQGELVVIHDDSVDRTTDARGTLQQLGIAKLRQLRAGGQPLSFLPDLVPFLEEFPALRCNVELKDEPSGLLAREELESWSAPVRSRLLVSSFHPTALEPWRESPIPRALCAKRLGPRAVTECVRLGGVAVHVSTRDLSADRVRAARERGLAVRVYTVNDPRQLPRLRELGVAGVFTDRPDLLLGGGVGALGRLGW